MLSLIRSLESLGLQPQCFQIIEDPSLNSTNITSHLNKLEELIEILLAGLLLKNNNNLSFKEEKHDNKLEINTINIEDYPEMFSKDSLFSTKAKDETERFLLEYELECRRSDELDDNIKNAKKELFETKRLLKDTLG